MARSPIVVDSSVRNAKSSVMSETTRARSPIVTGIIREAVLDAEDTPLYLVEVKHGADNRSIWCKHMTRWGGVHNYEEYNLRPYLRLGIQPPGLNMPYESPDVKAGDSVVVAEVGIDGRAGVILGGIPHAARTSKLEASTMVYRSEFNGCLTEIQESGAYKFTWKGGGTLNNKALDLPPTGFPIPEPTTEEILGGSFFEFNTNGSYTLSDNAENTFKINKQLKNMIFTSGAIQMQMGNTDALIPVNGTGEGFAIKSTTFGLEAEDVNIAHTGDFTVSNKTMNIVVSGKTIAIGNQGVELLKTIKELIEALGEVKVTSPVGPCTPLLATAEWVKVLLLLKGLEQITGSISKPIVPFGPAVEEPEAV